MNERSLAQAPNDHHRDGWGDAYLPVVQDPPAIGAAGPRFDGPWLRGALFRQRWIILGSVIAALVFGVVMTLLTTPTYEAEASVRVSTGGNTVVEGQELLQAYEKLDILLGTLTEVIKSRRLAERVAEALPPGTVDKLLPANIDEDRPAETSEQAWQKEKIILAASILRGSIEVDAPVNNQILKLRYRANDPVLAAIIANEYMTAFVASDAERNIDSNSYAREYLLEQIASVRTKLQDAEAQVNSYARQSGIVVQKTVDEEGNRGTLTGSSLASVNQSFIEARAARIAAEERWRALSSVPAINLPQVQANSTVQNLIAERTKLSADLVVLRERYVDDFPVVADLKSRIAILDGQIEQTAASIKASLRAEYEIAQKQEAALRGALSSVTEDAMIEQGLAGEYQALERESNALRTELDSLLNRYNSISTAANVQSGTITPLDRATVPGAPVAPSLRKNLSLALVLGIALAAGLGLIREIFVDQFRQSDDLETRLNVQALGQTPYIKPDEIDNAGAYALSSLTESYSSIRSRIAYSLPNGSSVIQFTSSQAAEGKSTSAVMLAEMFARLGHSTVLVDADLRKPSIAKLLDLEKPKVGLVEVVQGNVTFDEAKIVRDNLTVLPISSPPPDPVGLITSIRFGELIEELREKYSLVIIDSTPVLGLADAPDVARHVDFTVYVVEANRTSLAQARAGIQRIMRVGGNVLGAVLTKYRALEAGSGYGDEYRYYRYGQD